MLQSWPWGAPSVASYDPSKCPISSEHFLSYLFSAQDVLGSSCTSPSPALESAFPQEVLLPFSGEGSLETNIFMVDVLIAPGVSLL